jgi:iron only hydrogenase large subunit-like protein
MLMLAKAGKYNGYLLEGMACPGGCIGGAGTIADPARTAGVLAKYKSAAPYTDPEKSPFINNIHFLKDDIDQYEE